MTSFYSILKLSPNVATEDSVAIGLLVFDGEQFRHYFSDKKKRLAKSLLDEKEVNLNFIVNQVIEKCDTVNSDKEELKIFYKFDQLSEISYFEYLSNYSNGLIQFSKPKALYETINNSAFAKLVQFFFNEPLHKALVKKEGQFALSTGIIEKKLISKVNKKVHTYFKFEPKAFPSIYFPFEVDCIGQNGSLIGAKSIDFDMSLPVIDKNVSHYVTLISSLTRQYNQSLKDNHFFLMADEPKEVGSKVHKLWESIKYNKLISVINPEESDTVADLIIQKKASKFLD